MSQTPAVRETHQNLSVDTLNGSINNSVTTVTVSTGSVFPSTGNYRVMVDDEIMKVTARSTNDLTVVRGQDGTAAASHSNAAPIALILTKQSLARLLLDNDPSAGWSGTKPQGQLLDTDGVTLLTSSDFTWVNQGGATISDDGGTLLLTVPTDSGTNVRGMERTPPATPYTYIAAFSVVCPSTDSDAKPRFGLAFRETSSGKLMLCDFVTESFFNNKFNVSISRYNSTSSLFTTNDGPREIQIISDLMWVKIENDGTNTKWHLSPDGVNWIQYFSEAKNSWFSSGPDRVLWYGINFGNSGTGAVAMHVRLHHWSKGE